MSHAEQIEVLKGLLERVKAAEEGSHPLNVEVGRAIDADVPGAWPDYSRSSDAAVALAERALPAIKAFKAGSPASSGWKLTFYRGMTPTSESFGFWEANIRPHGKDGSTETGRTLPLAILSALLSAKLALLTQEEGR